METPGHAASAEASSTSPASASHPSLLLHEHLEQYLWVNSAHSTHPTAMAVHPAGLSVRIIQILLFDTIVITLLLDGIRQNLIRGIDIPENCLGLLLLFFGAA
jgi:hypothetical protein